MTTTNDQKPAIIKKPSSPFSNDPHNNRGGKAGNKAEFTKNGGPKMKSISVPKFRVGSGGDK